MYENHVGPDRIPRYPDLDVFLPGVCSKGHAAWSVQLGLVLRARERTVGICCMEMPKVGLAQGFIMEERGIFFV